MMHLDLLGCIGFLGRGDPEELRLESWLELGGSIGHLLMCLLSWLGSLHGHLLCADLREIKVQ